MSWLGRRQLTTTAPEPPGSNARRRAQHWLRSGLIDLEFYSTLRDRPFADELSGAVDLVRYGMPARLSPHPFLDFSSLPRPVRAAWRKGQVRPVLDHLAGDGLPRPVGPLAHTATPAQDREYMLGVARGIAEQTQGTEAESISLVERERRLVDWVALRRSLPQRRSGRTSVVVPTYADAAMTIRAVQATLTQSGDEDLEVVVVDNGSAPHVSLALAAAFRHTHDVDLVRLPVNLNFAGGSNVGFGHTTGDVIVFLNNQTEVRRGWLPPLRAALDDPDVAGAQPLLLYGDDTIQTAGTVFPGSGLLPSHLLVGHPPEDATGLAGERLCAVTGAALTMRASDVVRLEGFDSAYVNGFEDVDLCLRLLGRRPGGYRVVPESRVTHYESLTPGRSASVDANRSRFVEAWGDWLTRSDLDIAERIGFRLAAPEPDCQPIPAARLDIQERVRSDGRLRWCLRLPSTPGWWGDDWGDTHFATGLADALMGLGQDVVTRRRGAHQRGPLHLDDVNLALRGRYPIEPVVGVVNVLWIISHPEDVERQELDGYDLVFAASRPWAANRTLEWGRPVLPLMQATGIMPGRASPPRAQPPAALFVGNANNGRRRPMVDAAVAAGIPLVVYGRGWEGALPDGSWRGAYVEPSQLPDLYAQYGVVLADHWPDMARHGFIANRIYDALAAGAKVVSDEVVGLEELAPGRVVVHRHGDDLRDTYQRLTAEDGDVTEAQPAGEHSFRARAEVLLDAVSSITQ